MDPNAAVPPPIVSPPKKFPLPFYLVILVVAAILLAVVLTGAYILQQGKTKGGSRPPTPSQNKKIVFAQQLLNSYPMTETDIKSQNSPFTCPVSASFCKDKNAYGSGAFSTQITNGTKIKAAFPGTAEGLYSTHPLPDNKNEEFMLVVLVNNKLGLQAMYYLKGTGTEKKEVLEGDIIATSSGMPISYMNNKSLTFSLIKNKKEGGMAEKLSPASFR